MTTAERTFTQIHEHTSAANGTSFQSTTGRYTPQQIIDVFGKGILFDDLIGGDGKVRWEWMFQDQDGNVFTVYDYKNDTSLNQEYDWHIGCKSGVPTSYFCLWFTNKMANLKPAYDPDAIVTGSMYDNSSPLRETHDKLYEELVPQTGMARTTHGEALRAICRLYHDAYNNGGCNSHSTFYSYCHMFLDMWAVTNGAEIHSAEMLALHTIETTLKRARKEAERDEEMEFDNESREGWDALNDKPYLDALEMIAHWVTWKVSKMM